MIGRRLVPPLLAAGHDVTAISRHPERRRWVEEAGARLVEADAFDADRLGAVAADTSPDVVIHQLTSLLPALDPRRLDEQLAENDKLLVEGT